MYLSSGERRQGVQLQQPRRCVHRAEEEPLPTHLSRCQGGLADNICSFNDSVDNPRMVMNCVEDNANNYFVDPVDL